MHFSALAVADATKIKVHENRDSKEREPIIVIYNQEVIDQTIEFLITRERRWRAPWAGVPIGKIRIVFWHEENRIRSIAIGNDFIEAQGCGYVFIKDISERELMYLESLLQFKIKPS